MPFAVADRSRRQERECDVQAHGADDRRLSGMGHGAAGAGVRPAQAVARGGQGGVSRRGRPGGARHRHPRRARRIGRADRPLPPARDRLLLRRRRRRHRPSARARPRRPGHQHARRSHRGRGGLRLRAHPRPHAQGDRRRRARPIRRMARGRTAARREPAWQDARHSRVRAHRPRHRATRRGVWFDDRLFRHHSGGGRLLRLLPDPGGTRGGERHPRRLRVRRRGDTRAS